MSRTDCSAKGNGKGTSIGKGKRQDKDDGNGEEKEGTRYMLSGQTWLLCPAASGRSVPPKRDGDRMGVRSSGGSTGASTAGPSRSTSSSGSPPESASGLGRPSRPPLLHFIPWSSMCAGRPQLCADDGSILVS